MSWQAPFRRATLRDDAVAGVVLGVQSVPDGLATGLLAGVNPLAGLYGYLVGTITGACFTSSSFMAVQATGAMAMVITDVRVVHQASDPGRALFTLSVLTGVAMLAAGLLRLGSVLRFVSNAVMVGFIKRGGPQHRARPARQPHRLRPRRLQPRRPCVRHAAPPGPPPPADPRDRRDDDRADRPARAGQGGAARPGGRGDRHLRGGGGARVERGGDPERPRRGAQRAPTPQLPSLRLVPALIVPAVSLAFVGLVQGAGISANFPDDDGTYPDVSCDFVGQGAANVASGLLQGMPVGGSMSASSLNKAAGARSRQALIFAGIVMGLVIVAFGRVVGYVAMPALAGLLMLIGYRTIKPADLQSVWRTGPVQKAVVAVTFGLTMVIPLQYSVLVGVGLSVILHVVRQSNQVTIRRWQLDAEGQLIEGDPPATLPPHEVIVLQPYGSLFFAAAQVFESGLPSPSGSTRGSVVILRLRGRSDLGTTFMDVLHRYARSLAAADSKLVVVSANERIVEQLTVTGITATIGAANVYPGDERVGATVRQAYADALDWVDAQRR
ncbi:MAG: SulP family inorganic anion transporter [Acidimicrobiales bacterium]